MKKILCFILTILLLSTSLVFADTNINNYNVDKAIKSAKAVKNIEKFSSYDLEGNEVSEDLSLIAVDEQKNILKNYQIIAETVSKDLYGGMYIDDDNNLVFMKLDDFYNVENNNLNELFNKLNLSGLEKKLVQDKIKMKSAKYSQSDLEKAYFFLSELSIELSIHSLAIEAETNRISIALDGDNKLEMENNIINIVKKNLVEYLQNKDVKDMFVFVEKPNEELMSTLKSIDNKTIFKELDDVTNVITLDESYNGEYAIASIKTISPTTPITTSYGTGSIAYPYLSGIVSSTHGGDSSAAWVDGIIVGTIKRVQFSGNSDASYIELNANANWSSNLSYSYTSGTIPAGTIINQFGVTSGTKAGKILNAYATYNSNGVTFADCYYTNIGLLKGDSGGPLYVQDSTYRRVHGINSSTYSNNSYATKVYNFNY